MAEAPPTAPTKSAPPVRANKPRSDMPSRTVRPHVLHPQTRVQTKQRMQDITPSASSVEIFETSPGPTYETQRELRHQWQVIQSHLQKAIEQHHLRSLSEARSVQTSVAIVPAPNAARYLIGKTLAIVLDFVDILTTLGAVSGVGWVVGVILDSLFGVILYKWVSQGYSAKSEQARVNIEGKIGAIDRRITSYRKTAAKLARTGRKVPRLRKPLRKLSRKSRSVRKKFKPLRRLLVAVGIDSIPVVELLPMKYLLVRTMYKEHKAAYAENQQETQNFMRSQRQEMQQFSEQQLQQAEALYASYVESVTS